MTMLIFLDTEYTGLNQTAPKLISLALVAEDGRREFYIELADTWTLDDCNSFVKHEVVPLLDGPRWSRTEAGASLRAWFADAPRSVQAACDSITDWQFLLDLLGSPLPANLVDHYFDLRPLIDTVIYDRTVAEYHKANAREHHALADARAYRRGWLAWMDARKTLSC
ncbi:3'-5' exonuclease family protein [Paraburkholderia fungorum]|uniref:hypothetical protein n=1 Tax=Paraburkholderia fungorum TaxID=134537 RepID=UPI0038B77B87